MSRKMKFALGILIFTCAAAVPWVSGQAGPPANKVLLSYERISESLSGDILTIQMNLTAKCIGPGVVQAVRVSAVDADGASLSPASQFIGDLASEEAVSIPLTISYAQSQEPPQILWKLEFTDSEGVYRSQVLSLN